MKCVKSDDLWKPAQSISKGSWDSLESKQENGVATITVVVVVVVVIKN